MVWAIWSSISSVNSLSVISFSSRSSAIDCCVAAIICFNLSDLMEMSIFSSMMDKNTIAYTTFVVASISPSVSVTSSTSAIDCVAKCLTWKPREPKKRRGSRSDRMIFPTFFCIMQIMRMIGKISRLIIARMKPQRGINPKMQSDKLIMRRMPESFFDFQSDCFSTGRGVVVIRYLSYHACIECQSDDASCHKRRHALMIMPAATRGTVAGDIILRELLFDGEAHLFKRFFLART